MADAVLAELRRLRPDIDGSDVVSEMTSCFGDAELIPPYDARWWAEWAALLIDIHGSDLKRMVGDEMAPVFGEADSFHGESHPVSIMLESLAMNPCADLATGVLRELKRLMGDLTWEMVSLSCYYTQHWDDDRVLERYLGLVKRLGLPSPTRAEFAEFVADLSTDLDTERVRELALFD